MKNKRTLKLIGKAKEVGKKLGEVIKNIDFHFLKDISIQKERIKEFTKIISNIAPWWMEEVDGFAEKVDIAKEKILMFNCLPHKPGKYYLGSCSSFLVMSDRSKTNSPILLKIRDERPFHQIAGIKKIEGTYKYIFGTNVGNIGIAHFLNEKGLAGANNTGSPVISGIKDFGLNDCLIMRLIAEKAENCENALEIMKMLIGKGYVGSAGYRKGMIFLFVDPKRGLIIENTSEKLCYKFVEKGVFVYTNHFLFEEMKDEIDRKRTSEIPSKSSNIRWLRGKELIEEMGNRKIGIEDLKRFSRDTKNFPYSLCNSSNTFPWRTLSAFIHRIGNISEGAHYSFISNGVPISTEYICLSITEEKTPLSLLTDYTI